MARSRMDILTRLADAGEEAIAKLTDAPAADRMVGAVTSMRDRLDELQKRVRGIDDLERRVAELERKLDARKPARAGATARSAAAKKGAKAKSTTAAKPKAKASSAAKSGASTSKPKASTATRATSKSSTRGTGSGSPG